MNKNKEESIGRIKVNKSKKLENEAIKGKVPEDNFDELLLHIQNCHKPNKDKS